MTKVTQTVGLPADPFDRDFAEAWIPKAGDALLNCEVLAVDERVSKFDKTQQKKVPIVTVRVGPGSTEAGELLEDGAVKAVHAIHGHLVKQFVKLRLAPGEKVALKFSGWFPDGAPWGGLGSDKKPEGLGADEGSYRYRVHRYGDEARGIDWSAYGKGDDELVPAAADARGLEFLPEHTRKAQRPSEPDSVAYGSDDEIPF